MSKMFRLPIILTLLVVSAAVAAVSPARAEGPRPRIHRMEWLSRPLTAGAVEILEIRAIDVDGVVTTANVAWGDGVLTHADLVCFDKGRVATVRLTHVFRRPGAYTVSARVGSGPRCFTTDQASPTERLRAVVRP